MRQINVNALCVRTVDYKDNDRLITLCTIGKGKILAKATGCKKPKAKLRYASSPLCFGEYTLLENNGRYTLTGCEAVDTFNNVSADLEKYYAAFAALEILDKLTAEGDEQGCAELTVLTVNALKDIVYGEKPVYIYLAAFIKDTLFAAGYGLNFESCAISGKPLDSSRVCFDYITGGFVLNSVKSACFINVKPSVFDFLRGDEADTATQKEGIFLLYDVLKNCAQITKIYALDMLLAL